MSAWGKYDDKASTGTITIGFNGAVTGSGTAFTDELLTGDFIKTADGNSYIVIAVEDDTTATVINADPELGDLVEQSGVNFTVSEKPTSIASDPNTLASDVYNVDRYEIHGDQSGGYVSAVAIIDGGSGYLEVPPVNVIGPASATATIADGKVTSITVTNNGYGYSEAPAVYVNVPARTIPTANVNTTTEVITYTGHGLSSGDQIQYYNGGGTTMGGLTNTQMYYAFVINADTFKVCGSAADVEDEIFINLSGTGNNLQFFDIHTPATATTATAAAALGVSQGDATGDAGAIAHTGWVKRKVLEGQHAGRIQYEVLVAQSKNAGVSDAADDIEFPED